MVRLSDLSWSLQAVLGEEFSQPSSERATVAVSHGVALSALLPLLSMLSMLMLMLSMLMCCLRLGLGLRHVRSVCRTYEVHDNLFIIYIL
jgi:hypothetical protein